MGIPKIGGLNDSQNKVAWIIFQTLTTRYKASEGVACGIVGNAYCESWLNPNQGEIGSGDYLGGSSELGWGLYQITFAVQKKRAWEWMDKNGGRGPIQQTVYAIEYSNNTNVKVSDLRQDKTPEQGCNYWYTHYEYPGDASYGWSPSPRMFIPSQHRDRRIEWANKVYSAFKGRGGEDLSDELKKMNKFDLGGPINGEDEGPKYVSFEEALIKNFKSGKKAAPEGIAIHNITSTSSAKAAKDTLLKGGNVGIAGAQFHLVCDSKDAFLVVDLADRVSHIQRTNKNFSSISEPNSKIISIGVCGGVEKGSNMAKAAQVAAEVCHLLSLSPSTVNGAYKFDGVADPAGWKDQEGTLIGEEGEFSNMAFQKAVSTALDNDIGGISEATGVGGGGGRGSMKKVIEVAEKWHDMNDKCYYLLGGKTGKGPFSGGFDCSSFVMSSIRGAGYSVGHMNTVGMLQNCKPLEGEKNSDQCRGGKNAFFRQIKPSEAQKGDILVAGGLGGNGGGGHTGFVWSSYKGGSTKFMNSGGCSAEGRKQPNLSTIQCAMGSLGQFVYMTINKGDSDRESTSSEKQVSKKKKDKNVGISFSNGRSRLFSLYSDNLPKGDFKVVDWDKNRIKLSNDKWYDKDIQYQGRLFQTSENKLGSFTANKKIIGKNFM